MVVFYFKRLIILSLFAPTVFCYEVRDTVHYPIKILFEEFSFLKIWCLKLCILIYEGQVVGWWAKWVWQTNLLPTTIKSTSNIWWNSCNRCLKHSAKLWLTHPIWVKRGAACFQCLLSPPFSPELLFLVLLQAKQAFDRSIEMSWKHFL